MYISILTDIIASILHNLNTYNILVILINKTYNISYIINDTYKK
jgi:hypothetical protein